MGLLETELNKALELMQKGASLEQTLLECAQENRQELLEMLKISQALLSLPKNIVPTPLMQKKYAAISAKHFWLAWIHVSRLAGASMSVLLILSTLAFTGYKAYNSNPGSNLFAVKRVAEKFQLILASNKDAKANLQIAITQKRLAEATEIFNNPKSDLEEKKAALSELNSQTISAVEAVAENSQKSQEAPPQLSSLVSITQQQKDLLDNIKPDTQIVAETKTAQDTLSQSAAKITEIKQSVATASNTAALASLNTDDNSVIILGSVNSITRQQITVEKTSFNFTSKTVIKDSEGKPLTVDSLALNVKVNIAGAKTKDGLLAEQIIVTKNSTAQGEVKSASTTSVSSIPDSKNSSGTPAAASTAKKPSAGDFLLPDPGQASAGFIIEDPNPKFKP